MSRALLQLDEDLVVAGGAEVAGAVGVALLPVVHLPLVVPQTPGAVKGTEDYISHIDYLVNAVASALAGS